MSALAFLPLDLRHPHLVVVDGSKLVRKLLLGLMAKTLPDALVTECESGEKAKAVLMSQPVHLLVTALVLPDMDGDELARFAREQSTQSYFPVIAVSADVQSRLERRSLSPHVTDYFDKIWGMDALAEFVKGYLAPDKEASGEVLFFPDVKVRIPRPVYTATVIAGNGRWRLVVPAEPRATEGLDLLVFGGGGNMGLRYPGNHALRTQALATGLPVVILPQSFTSPEDRPFAQVFVRERGSLALRPDGILAPDLALGLATGEPGRPDRELGVYLRRDQERGGRKPLFARDPVRLFRDPFAYLAFAARHRRIVTDRLHFAVAGLHAGREVTLVANDYHKNRSMHETWLADLGCRFAETASEALGRRAA